MLGLLVLCLYMELAYTSSPLPHLLLKKKGLPLARGFAKPPSVDSELDCAIKELAFDYAKDLMINVSL